MDVNNDISSNLYTTVSSIVSIDWTVTAFVTLGLKCVAIITKSYVDVKLMATGKRVLP